MLSVGIPTPVHGGKVIVVGVTPLGQMGATWLCREGGRLRRLCRGWRWRTEDKKTPEQNNTRAADHYKPPEACRYDSAPRPFHGIRGVYGRNHAQETCEELHDTTISVTTGEEDSSWIGLRTTERNVHRAQERCHFELQSST